MTNIKILEPILTKLGERQTENLLNEIKGKERLQPKLSVSKVFAFVFATVIHCITFAIALAGISLIVASFPSIFFILIGLVFLGLAWVLRPRQANIQAKAHPSNQLPQLNSLTEKIGNKLNAPHFSGFLIGGQFNAGYFRRGLPQKHYLEVGLPLWAILSSQEKVALIAHEIAHSVNGDAMRGSYIGSAIFSLSEWHYLLVPDQIWDANAGIVGIVAIPFNVIMWLVSKLFYVCAYLMSLLLYRDMQRAEYLADHLAVETAGSAAMVSLLRKLHLDEEIWAVIKRYSLNDLDATDLFPELKSKDWSLLENTSMDYSESILGRLDVTHPPTAFRIKQINNKEQVLPSFKLGEDDEKAIDEELSQFETFLARKLMQMYEASLYYH